MLYILIHNTLKMPGGIPHCEAWDSTAITSLYLPPTKETSPHHQAGWPAVAKSWFVTELKDQKNKRAFHTTVRNAPWEHLQKRLAPNYFLPGLEFLELEQNTAW